MRCNLFPWDVTCSIKSRKEPFSGMTNTQIHTHAHTRMHVHRHAGTHYSWESWEDLNRTQTNDSHTSSLFLHQLPTLPWTYTLAYKGTRTEIPFCQLSAPDHVTIKDAAPQLNTASKSQGKESCEKHLFLSSTRDHTGGEGVEADRKRQGERERGRESVFVRCVLALCVMKRWITAI